MTIRKNGKRHCYWQLVRSVRTARGPRQEVVAHLGLAPESRRRGALEAARGREDRQGELFASEKAEYVEIDAKRVRVENVRDFGGAWLGLELVKRLKLDRFFREAFPGGQEDVSWWAMALVLTISRLTDPSSELRIAEHGYPGSALSDLLGVPAEKVNDDRLYRALDRLLPRKGDLETFLSGAVQGLFPGEHDLWLYDVTSTYFEGEAKANPKAQRGHSRDHRSDCKQVTIALVVSRHGLPVGYEVFAGNRNDMTTLQEIVGVMEGKYGKSDRIWVFDRGMASEANLAFMKEGGRRYVVGTPRSLLRDFEQALLSADWIEVRDGLRVKALPSTDGAETFVLARSRDRGEKEKAMHERFMARIEARLEKIAEACRKRKLEPVTVAQRVGKVMGQNTRGAWAFETTVTTEPDGRARLEWRKRPERLEWAALSEGCYLLRTNVTGLSADELWRTYMQLVEAEAAFRIHKSDLKIRPIWHQKEERADAHILVCFLAYVLWKTLGMWCEQSGLGDEPRRVFDEIARIKTADVLLPTRNGPVIRKRCVTRPSPHQAILLEHLGLDLPSRLETIETE